MNINEQEGEAAGVCVVYTSEPKARVDAGEGGGCVEPPVNHLTANPAGQRSLLKGACSVCVCVWPHYSNLVWKH